MCYLPSSEIEAEDPANLPTMHRTATTRKNDSAQDVDSAVVEDPSSAGPSVRRSGGTCASESTLRCNQTPAHSVLAPNGSYVG